MCALPNRKPTTQKPNNKQKYNLCTWKIKEIKRISETVHIYAGLVTCIVLLYVNEHAFMP